MFFAKSSQGKMWPRRSLITILAIGSMTGLLTIPVMAQSPIANGSFETGDYTGWTLFEGLPGTPGTVVQCGIWGIATNGQTINQGDTTFDFFNLVPVAHDFPTNALPWTFTATDGNSVAYQLQNCTQTHRMSQAIAVCNNATDLTWDMEYESNVPFVGKSTSPNFAQELAVEIRDLPGTTILATLFTTDPASPTIPANPLAVPLQSFTADISAFAGQTVRLTVDMQVNINPLAAYFDNFRIESCEKIDVDIDIKPGSFPNSINSCSKGAIPIAILGSASLDVNDIDPSTLTFAGAGVKIVGKTDKILCSVEDVSGPPPGPGGASDPSGVGDGIDDLVCHFVTIELTLIAAGDATADVAGELFDGTPFEGTDTINIVKDDCL